MGQLHRPAFSNVSRAFLFVALLGLFISPASAEIVEITGDGKSADWNWSKSTVEGSATSDAQYRARRQCEKQGGAPTTPAEKAVANCTCRNREGTRIIDGARVKAVEYSCACSVTIDCRIGGISAELRQKFAILKAFINDVAQNWDDAIRKHLRHIIIKKPWPAAFAEAMDDLYDFQDRFHQFRDDIRAIQEPSLNEVYIEKMVALKAELESDWAEIGTKWNAAVVQDFIREATAKPKQPKPPEKPAAKKDPGRDKLKKDLMKAAGLKQNKGTDVSKKRYPANVATDARQGKIAPKPEGKPNLTQQLLRATKTAPATPANDPKQPAARNPKHLSLTDRLLAATKPSPAAEATPGTVNPPNAADFPELYVVDGQCYALYDYDGRLSFKARLSGQPRLKDQKIAGLDFELEQLFTRLHRLNFFSGTTDFSRFNFIQEHHTLDDIVSVVEATYFPNAELLRFLKRCHAISSKVPVKFLIQIIPLSHYNTSKLSFDFGPLFLRKPFSPDSPSFALGELKCQIEDRGYPYETYTGTSYYPVYLAHFDKTGLDRLRQTIETTNGYFDPITKHTIVYQPYMGVSQNFLFKEKSPLWRLFFRHFNGEAFRSGGEYGQHDGSYYQRDGQVISRQLSFYFWELRSCLWSYDTTNRAWMRTYLVDGQPQSLRKTVEESQALIRRGQSRDINFESSFRLIP